MTDGKLPPFDRLRRRLDRVTKIDDPDAKIDRAFRPAAASKADSKGASPMRALSHDHSKAFMGEENAEQVEARRGSISMLGDPTATSGAGYSRGKHHPLGTNQSGPDGMHVARSRKGGFYLKLNDNKAFADSRSVREARALTDNLQKAVKPNAPAGKRRAPSFKEAADKYTKASRDPSISYDTRVANRVTGMLLNYVAKHGIAAAEKAGRLERVVTNHAGNSKGVALRDKGVKHEESRVTDPATGKPKRNELRVQVVRGKAAKTLGVKSGSLAKRHLERSHAVGPEPNRAKSYSASETTEDPGRHQGAAEQSGGRARPSHGSGVPRAATKVQGKSRGATQGASAEPPKSPSRQALPRGGGSPLEGARSTTLGSRQSKATAQSATAGHTTSLPAGGGQPAKRLRVGDGSVRSVASSPNSRSTLFKGD